MGISFDVNSASLMSSPRKSKAKLKSNVMPTDKVGLFLHSWCFGFASWLFVCINLLNDFLGLYDYVQLISWASQVACLFLGLLLLTLIHSISLSLRHWGRQLKPICSVSWIWIGSLYLYLLMVFLAQKLSVSLCLSQISFFDAESLIPWL